MKKRIVFGVAAVGTALAMLPLLAAFEAHVVNVTARIENALNVPIRSLDFGTVFPQEMLDLTFDVSLSQSFRDEERVDDVDYFIRQKPKCGVVIPETNPIAYSSYLQVGHDENGGFECPDGSVALPLLCPYLSKSEITTDGIAPGGENDGAPLASFHGPIALADWTMAVAESFDVDGHLAKAQQDYSDTWNIDLKVPCFGGHCAQDWADFVHSINPLANPDNYTQPIDLEHQQYGCDLWLEVGGISLARLCDEELDLMLVLDRSNSIDDAEEATLKAAANSFVSSLAPSTAGVHVGQTSFSTTGTLDLQLTDNEALAHAAINAITTSGNTNLFDGITLATGELDDTHVHERPAVKDVMVIITDGNPNEPANAEVVAAAAADAARAAGIEVFVVGIGADVDATYLTDEIADDAGHYFAAANFSDLEAVLQAIIDCDECDPGTHTVVSNTSNTVTENAGANAFALSFVHPAWTASIPGATWIWEEDGVGDPDNTETFTFVKTFTIDGSVTGTPTIDIATDNRYTVEVNNVVACSSIDDNNFQLATQDTCNVNNIVPGVNTIEITVTNIGFPGGEQGNPAGLLYKLTYDEVCPVR